MTAITSGRDLHRRHMPQTHEQQSDMPATASDTRSTTCVMHYSPASLQLLGHFRRFRARDVAQAEVSASIAVRCAVVIAKPLPRANMSLFRNSGNYGVLPARVCSVAVRGGIIKAAVALRTQHALRRLPPAVAAERLHQLILPGSKATTVYFRSCPIHSNARAEVRQHRTILHKMLPAAASCDLTAGCASCNTVRVVVIGGSDAGDGQGARKC